MLSIAGIRARLGVGLTSRQLFLFQEVESTNATLDWLARSGVPEGTVVLAEAQTGGRGRLGQPWFSPPGVNLYVSVLFRERLTLDEVPVFSFVAGLALADAVKKAGASPTIKWPHDVLVDGRKMAGARIECSARDSEVEHVIIGVGVNLNVELDDLALALGPKAEATSLRAATGHEIDRDIFAADYLNALDTWVRRYREDGPTPILEAWRGRDVLTGRQVEIHDAGGAFVGRVAGVHRHGRLLVRDAVGESRTVTTEAIRPCD
jgi:BirA family biotin operon repressor/biotin-[acetyl-CoA-carboxylase] ligase